MVSNVVKRDVKISRMNTTFDTQISFVIKYQPFNISKKIHFTGNENVDNMKVSDMRSNIIG